MKRLLAIFALAVPLAAPVSLSAEEVPHLEFVRELRARYPDLAGDYLEILRQSNPPPAVAAVIPLELAKVHLQLANGEPDANSRLALYNKARQEFQEFIDKNPKNIFVAEARVELARVTALQGRTQLNRALLDPDGAAREKGALQARDTFVQANAQIQAAADQLRSDLDKYPEPKTPQQKSEKAALEQARIQAQIDLGLNFFDQALTYLDNGNTQLLLQRGKILEQAIGILQKVANGDTKNPLTYQARAWIGYCYFQNGDNVKANAKLKEVAGLTEREAAAGRRLAMYFQMKILFDPQTPVKDTDIEQVRKDAVTWLNEYRTFAGTPEGCGVRYYLADALYRQAQQMKEKAPRAKLLAQARDICHDLSGTENEYRDRARVLSVRVIGLEGGFEKEIGKLANFDECVTRAEYEAVKVKEFAEQKKKELADKKDPKPEDVAKTGEEIDKERKLRTDNAIAALKKGLELAGNSGSKVSPADIGKARMTLCYYYFSSNRNKEAISVGEEAARVVPPTAQSAFTAMYVLEAFNNDIHESIRKGSATLTDLEQDGTLARMKSLADMMIERWPNEQAGDVGRHMRGLLFIKQKKTAEALDDLSKVSPKYPALIYVKYQLALTAFQAGQDRNAQAKAEPDMTKKEEFAKEEAQFEKQAMDALKSLPDLPREIDPTTTSIWLNAKLDLARTHFRHKEYAEISKVVDPVIAALDAGAYRLDGLPPDPEDPKTPPLERTRMSLRLWKLYGLYGMADAEFNAGHPAKVKEITDPIVKEFLEDKSPELKSNPTLRWGLMGLVLRVSIQEGNTARALQVLEKVQKSAEKDGGDAAKEGAAKGILMEVAKMVKDQLREVRKKKDTDAVKEAVGKYTQFLDELGKGSKPKGAEEEFHRILAEGYAALGNHEKAVEMARLVMEPNPDAYKGEKDPDKVFKNKSSNYHFCRFLIVRELRLDGNEDKLKEAAAELDEIRKTAWGKDHPETTKETLHLLGVKNPGKAYTEWSKLLNSLGQKMQQGGSKETREQYFECYYYSTDCMTHFAKTSKKKEDYLKRAANLIIKLEKGYPDLGGEDSKARFLDLLDREPELKEQYDQLKGDK